MAKKKATKKKSARRTSPARAPNPKPKKQPSPSVGPSLKDLCRSLPGTTEDVKWADDLVFSVGGKMYAAFDLDDDRSFAFKCDDDDFDRLTALKGIIPAPFAARFGWVKVHDPKALPEAEWRSLLRKAYSIVRSCLPKKTQAALGDY